MEVENTESVREVLRLASADEKLLDRSTVPWEAVLDAVRTVRRETNADDVWLHTACRGATLTYPKPDPPKPRNPELVKRLAKIKAEIDRKKYDAMVKDVDPSVSSKDYVYMSTYTDQLGLGVNTVVLMGTLFALGYYVGTKLAGGSGRDPGQNILPLCLGLAGAFLGMILETLLFMIRNNRTGEAGGKGARVRREKSSPGGKVKLH